MSETFVLEKDGLAIKNLGNSRLLDKKRLLELQQVLYGWTEAEALDWNAEAFDMGLAQFVLKRQEELGLSNRTIAWILGQLERWFTARAKVVEKLKQR